jgi:hypothetical protein
LTAPGTTAGTGAEGRRLAFVLSDQQRRAFDLIANTVSGASLHGVSARMGLSMLHTKEVITPLVRRRWLKRVADGAVYAATPAGRAALASSPSAPPDRAGDAPTVEGED